MNLQPGDVVELAYGREAIVTARVETDGGRLAALLEVMVATGPASGGSNSESAT